MKINSKFLAFSLFLSWFIFQPGSFAEEGDSISQKSEKANDSIEYDIFGFRFQKGRISALKKYGGSEATEMAVIKALRWLKENQNSDGSWGSNTGISGLALLAFLGHGETPESERYGECVRKGIEYLVDVSKKHSGLITNNNSIEGYTHAIATFAICEAYGLTRDNGIRGIMDNAVGKIIEGQNSSGGFDYRYGNSRRSDLSVSGWNMQALNAAKQSSCHLEGLDNAISKSVLSTKKLSNPKTGMFCYDNSSNSGSESLTGVGTLCLSELNGNGSEEFKSALRYLIKNAKFNWDSEINWPIYAWYYQTLTFFRAEQNWDAWNRQMIKTLTANQFEDGHWEESKNFGLTGIDLKVYSTALCAMMLEVYYRYYNSSTASEVSKNGAKKDFEIYIEKKGKKERHKIRGPLY